jgi:hypothetical protein
MPKIAVTTTLPRDAGNLAGRLVRADGARCCRDTGRPGYANRVACPL